MSVPIFINDLQVKRIISWPLVNDAVEEAFKSICSTKSCSKCDQSFANQPARSKTTTDNGILFTMPGFVGNYTLSSKKFNTLGCKMVTMFQANEQKEPPLPNILANIMLFNSTTGQLECVMDGTEITAWRTASASVVATKYLYFKRTNRSKSKPVVAIVGCGVQGYSHSMGLCHTFDLSEIRLWNRTKSKAINLLKTLEDTKSEFVNKNLEIKVVNSVEECVADADIIVTSTFVTEPLIELEMLKSNCHINAVGCGPGSHHSELSQEIYDNSSLYIDHWAGAKAELNTLKANISGEVGEVINSGSIASDDITIFQSLGMAVEDVTVAQAVFEAIQKTN